MILRRITKHVKEQNWFAVGVDFLIVVMGILIAFQITEWSQTREDAENYQYLRQAVLDEVQLNVTIGAETTKKATAYMDVARMAITDLENCGANPGAVERINRSISTLAFIIRVPVRRDALVQLITSEQFKSNKHESNKALFASYARAVERLQRSSEGNVNGSSNDILDHRFWTRGELRKPVIGGFEFDVYESLLDVDFKTACSDKEFNLLYTKRFHHGTYQRNLAQQLERESKNLLDALGADIKVLSVVN